MMIFHGVGRRRTAVLLLLVLWCISAGCGKEQPIKVDPERTISEMRETGHAGTKSLRIALGAVLTPEVGFAYYRQLLDHISEELGRPVECIERNSYAEINSLLKAGEVDMAFVCSRPYVDGKDEFGLELLVAPQVRGKTEYYSYIIVASNSTAKTLNDLKGKTFAFTDPMSNTGRLAPVHYLKDRGEEPERFFSNSLYTHAHDRTIKLVSQKVVDGGAVDSLVWEYERERHTGFASSTIVIEALGPFGIPPVVVRKGLDADVKHRLRDILLNTHRDEAGAKILRGMMVERFVATSDEAYDSIRHMRDAADQEKEKTR